MTVIRHETRKGQDHGPGVEIRATTVAKLPGRGWRPFGSIEFGNVVYCVIRVNEPRFWSYR